MATTSYRKKDYATSGGTVFMLSPLLPDVKQTITYYDSKKNIYLRSMRKYFVKKWLCGLLALTIVLVCILYYTGLGAVLFFETPFAQFRWPLYVDTKEQVDMYLSEGMGRYPSLNDWSNKIIINPRKSLVQCWNPVDPHVPYPVYLRMLVKSKAEHYENRRVIRELWLNQNLRPVDKNIELVFLLGVSEDANVNSRVIVEADEYHDILQSDTVDNYYNNTLKTMGAFEWLLQCQDYHFVFFVDDDFHVNVTNILTFLSDKVSSEELYTGFRFDTCPFRSPLFKHYVSMEEYPFSRYPPYVAAGAYILSRNSAVRLCVAARYVYKYRFDDVYLGIVAHKLGLPVQHSDLFHFWPPTSVNDAGIPDAIAIHTGANLQLMKDLYKQRKR